MPTLDDSTSGRKSHVEGAVASSGRSIITICGVKIGEPSR
jgi:hypothetical protein